MTDSIPTWLKHPDLQRWLTALEAGGEETRFVGGCVRDFLLGKVSHDLDCATQYSPQDMMDLSEKAGFKTIPTGLDHGTVTIVIADDLAIEVTSLRRDVETHGRRAVVAFTKDWVEDAQRRDFTVNALYMDRDAQVYDPLGQGLDDLNGQRLRFVGDASTRIQEDPLRILRYFRFLHLFPDATRDSESLAACIQYQDLIATLSKERITQEIKTMLHTAQTGFQAMSEEGFSFFSLSLETDSLTRVTRMQETLNGPDQVTRMAALFASDPIEQVLSVFCLSKAQERTLRLLEELKTSPQDLPHLKITAYDHGKGAAIQSGILNGVESETLQALIDWPIPTPPFTAQDVMQEYGLKPGPELGEALKQKERAWLYQVTADKTMPS